MILTCGVGQLILLALYSVFQGLGIPPRDCYLLLDRLRIRVRHAVLKVMAASMAAVGGWMGDGGSGRRWRVREVVVRQTNGPVAALGAAVLGREGALTHTMSHCRRRGSQ